MLLVLCQALRGREGKEMEDILRQSERQKDRKGGREGERQRGSGETARWSDRKIKKTL